MPPAMIAYPVRSMVRAVPETPEPLDATWFDEPTGLPGPAFWRSVLAAESARSSRYGCASTVVLVELVGLPVGAAGHGDRRAQLAAIEIGIVLRTGARTSDYVVRLTGSGFAILLPETDEISAINFVERVRRASERLLEATDGVSIAFGWASPDGLGTLLQAAETAEERLRREMERP